MSRSLRFILWIALIALCGLGLSRLRFDAEVLNLLPSKLSAVQGLKIYQEHFANARELVITVQAPDADQAETAARILAEQLRPETNLIADVTWQPPWLERPGDAAELIAYLWLNQPPEVFAQLTNRFTQQSLSTALNAAREQLATSMSPGDIARLSYDPLGLTQLPASVSGAAPSFGEGQELFNSPDGTFRILFVHAATGLRSYRDNLAWFEKVKQFVRAAIEREQIPGVVQVGFTGGPAFVSEISSGMEGDLKKSVGGTVLIVVILFWIIHRRITPLLWLMALLGLVLAGTLGLAGLLFGTVNVVSVGFAAILLGLSADYGLVLYQEALHAHGADLGAIRRKIAPSIIWSAVTTSGAFLILNLGDLPGLAQLGSLVAIGVALAAVVMLLLFLRPFARGISAHERQTAPEAARDPAPPARLGWITTALLAIAALILLFRQPPGLDHTTNSLRPRDSSAYTAMEQIKRNLSREQEPDWVLVGGRSEQELADRLRQVEWALNHAASNGLIDSFTVPVSLLPNPAHQNANRPIAALLAANVESVRLTALSSGFTTNSTVFTENILTVWRAASETSKVFEPSNRMSRWVFDKVLARDDANLYAIGLVYLPKDSSAQPRNQWQTHLPREGVWVAGWERLGAELLNLVERDMWRVLLPMLALLLLSLWLAFKRLTEVLLSLASLALAALCLWALMGLLGWSWNLLNLLAIPLMLGAGVDYSIHMQLALRRHGGNARETRRTVGKALLLCAATTVAGFGSNAWSSNLGLASLGLVCASGVGISFLVSYFLLPSWWRTFAPSPVAGEVAPDSTELSAPSSLYRSEFWRMGLWIVRFIPRGICVLAAHFFAELYWRFAKERCQIVIENLLPVLDGDIRAATKQSRALLHQFAIKVVDLWQYEAGMPVERLLGQPSGWEHYARAQATGRGILLLTPHLGNWEFGGPWMTRRGVKLLVITLAEPGKKFTQLRQASRSRWNIETIVIGNDPFAFVEIIKRLEAGATVALLVDRPSPQTAVEVQLAGRPFMASVAAAELARASGCILLPVYMPHSAGAYDAHILPPITYDRPALRDRANRQKLTQEVIRTFEPVIRKHIDQWYQFIPIWPRK